ncbi:C6 transcription factor, partial [Colletotrichum plurivorum]
CRRKKCVENTFPVCGACARLNLKCIRGTTRDVVPPDWVDRKQQPVVRASRASDSQIVEQHQSRCFPLCPSAPSADHAEPPQRRHVMRYYIEILSQHLTVNEQFNSFLSAFLPMAMESTVLYDALVAFASGHLSLSHEAYRVSALEAHSTAISNLAAALGTPQNDITWYESKAATCLAFVIGDVCVGSRHGWYTHLNGARLVIESASATTSSGDTLHGPDVFKKSSEGQWILRNFAYHDIVASVTLRRRPLMDSGYLDGITDVVDTYLGVATGLLRHVSTLCFLDEETRLSPELAADEAAARMLRFRSTCAEVERELQDWRCRPDAAPELAALAHAFRGAVLIFLYRLVRTRLGDEGAAPSDDRVSTEGGWDILPTKIRTQVSSILRHVAEIPVGSHAESAILFPLFLAGGEAAEEEHIDAVRVRLQMTLQKRRFQNIALSLDTLEDLWQRRKGNNQIAVDWTDILDACGEPLLLT